MGMIDNILKSNRTRTEDIVEKTYRIGKEELLNALNISGKVTSVKVEDGFLIIKTKGG